MDEWFYQAIEDWVRDDYTKVMVKRLFTTMKNYGHFSNFICAKQTIEPQWDH